MPHIVFKKNNLAKTPSVKDGVDFDFTAKSINHTDKPRETVYKISTKNHNKNFLLTLRDKDEESYILKGDKTTRVTPVSIMKEALNAYAKLINSEILFSNTSNDNKKIKPQKDYLKDIDYFVNEFKTDKEIQIEVGFGSGRHLLYQAKENPEVQFIGLEIHTPSIEQLLKQIEILGLTNILVINYDARLFMEFINSNTVGRIFVHFPVPWDKKPHRRVYSNEFIAESKRVLKQKGTLELRTDSRKYFDYCMELLTNLNKGKIIIDINKDLAVSSKYEDRWKRMEKNIYDVVLLNDDIDEERVLDIDFNFDKKIDFFEVIKKLPYKPVVENGFFIHFEEFYEILDHKNSGLISMTFGSFDKPLNKYLLIKDGQISYFQGEPIPTSSNLNAHKKLKEILLND